MITTVLADDVYALLLGVLLGLWLRLSLGLWLLGNHTGGFYRCNKYDPKAAVKAKKEGKKEESKDVKENDKEAEKEEAKAELDRYLHYYQRYHNHDQSKTFAAAQRINTEKRMEHLQVCAWRPAVIFIRRPA